MDNLPTVLMEAMASSLPVVSTRIGGVPEMVVEGSTGLLVAEHQPAAFAEALERILVDQTFARSLGEGGRQRAADLFRVEKCVEELDSLFQSFDAA